MTLCEGIKYNNYNFSNLKTISLLYKVHFTKDECIFESHSSIYQTRSRIMKLSLKKLSLHVRQIEPKCNSLFPIKIMQLCGTHYFTIPVQ